MIQDTNSWEVLSLSLPHDSKYQAPSMDAELQRATFIHRKGIREIKTLKSRIHMSRAPLYLRTLRSPQMSICASLPHKPCKSHQCLSQAPLNSGPLMPAETRLALAALQEQGGQDRAVLESYYFCRKKLGTERKYSTCGLEASLKDSAMLPCSATKQKDWIKRCPFPPATSPLPHPTCIHLQDKDLTPSHLPQNGCLETAGPESKAALHHLFDCKCLNSPTEVIRALRQRGVDSAMVENVINVALSWTALQLWSCCCLVLGLLLTPPSFLNSEVHYRETLFGFPCLRVLWCSCHHRSCCWDSTSSLTIWKDFTERGSIFLASCWSKSMYFSFSPLNQRIQLRQRYWVFHICCCWVDEHSYLLENNIRALLIPTKELLFLLHGLLGELRTFRGGESKFSSWVLLQTPKPLHVHLLLNNEGRSVWERLSSSKRNV